MAGSGRVLELHGNTRIFDCLSCGRTESFESVLELQKKSLIPECPDCSGRLKPRVVFFGESLDPQVLKDAVETTEGCDLMLVVGSTLQVYPAAHLPIMVHQNRKPVIILNKGQPFSNGFFVIVTPKHRGHRVVFFVISDSLGKGSAFDNVALVVWLTIPR